MRTKREYKLVTLRRLVVGLLLLTLQSATCAIAASTTTKAALPTDTSTTSVPLDSHIAFVQDGPLSKQLHIPLYEWYPKDKQPAGIVLAVHGLTLHGKRYEVLGRAFAMEGFYVCAMDMRGFGRCYRTKEFSFGDERRDKVDNEGSYRDIVALTVAIKKKYPDVPLFVMGESLGTCFCIRLAADHPELIEGLLMSGPAVKVHPLMFVHPQTMAAAAVAVVWDPKFAMSTKSFVKNLVSNDPEIISEMLNDPLCRSNLTIADLVNTSAFVKKSLTYAPRVKPEIPILILQGSEDRCMVPHAVTHLSKNIRSADQTVRWLHAHGHILLETAFLRPATVDAIDLWMREHEPTHALEEENLAKEMTQIGAKVEEQDLPPLHADRPSTNKSTSADSPKN